MRILITGSTGFIGGFIVDFALQEGLEVFAATRKRSNKQYLQDKRINFLELNLANPEKLQEFLANFRSEIGNIDYVIHNAGITKAHRKSEYDQVNFSYTVNFIQALRDAGHRPKKFTYISSMAAAAPGSDITNLPIKINDPDHPVTAYGISKKKTETYLEENGIFPHMIVRPPAVFGPRDRDMFTVFDLINKNLELQIGSKKQLLSFIYVKDLARGIVKSALSDKVNKKYFLSDNKYYDNEQFNKAVKTYLKKKTFKIRLPIFAVYLVAFFAEIFSKITGNLSQLNLEKIKELKCSNWTCDANAFYEDMGIEPVYTLAEGIKETVDWYKKEKWLK